MKKYILSAAFIASACVAVAQPCNETIVATYNNPLCSGTDLMLTATFIPGASYGWEGPGGFLSFVRNTTLSNVSSVNMGNYIVTATVGSCVYKDTVYALVHPKPATPVVTFGKPVCDGDSLILNGSSGANVDTFLFWNASGNPQPPQMGNISPSANGIYSCVAISNVGCASDTGKFPVTVALPPATPIMTLAKPACSGDTLSLSASAPGGISGFFFFDPAGNPISSTLTGITYAQTGIYTCVAQSTAGCMSDTGMLSVLVHPTIVPGVAIYGSGESGPYDTLTFTSLVSNAGSSPVYTWMRNGNPIPGAAGSSYSAVNGWTIMPGDVVSLQVTADAAPCPGTGMSNEITIVRNLSVNDMDSKGGYAIFPNPAKGMIHIKTNLSGTYNVAILNVIGSSIYSATGSGNMDIDITNRVSAGNYIIRISNGQYTVSRKLSVTE